MRVIGVVIDGELHNPQGARISPPREPQRALTAPDRRRDDALTNGRRRSDHPLAEPMRDPVAEAASLLARVARLAHGLSEPDQRRVRELVHATASMLAATTVLDRGDQRLFERALREEA
ncbi:hypothetical protein IVA95_16195 [Bradyrhizobium sp. 157]|uniref:hypothetical protein n=1 Tax=Bradyrhizobium sp. 157 TaxID=2782631 RepID=UPI001FF948FC|nr:hypothetical protein [Bradyrhizobium sp. 157]MCK1639102.1 hypothetical protein [Bradyrhizobium sp. 157]